MANKVYEGHRTSKPNVTISVLVNDEEVLNQVNDILSKNFPAREAGDSHVKVVGQTTDLTSGFNLLKEHNPTIAIIGLASKADKSVSQLLERISETLPNICIFILGVKKDPDLMIKAMRAGCKEFITLPLKSQLLDAIDRVHMSIEQKACPIPRTIGVVSFKGGSGATVLAVNLAAALKSQTKERTLLVDMRQGGGDAALYLNLKYKCTMQDVISNIDRLDSSLLSGYLSDHSSGIKVLPAQVFLEQLREPQADLSVSVEKLEYLFDFIKTEFTYTVIDVGYAFSVESLELLRTLDDILLVITLDLANVSNAKQGLTVLGEVGLLEKTRLIVNRFDKRYAKDASAISIDDVVKTLEMPIFCNIPNDYILISECINLGLIAVIDKSKSRVAQKYLELAKLVSKGGVLSVSK